MCYAYTLLGFPGDAVTIVTAPQSGRPCRLEWRRGGTDDSTAGSSNTRSRCGITESWRFLTRRDRAETIGDCLPIDAESTATPRAASSDRCRTFPSRPAAYLRGRPRRESCILGRGESPGAVGLTTHDGRRMDGLSPDVDSLRHRLTRHARTRDDDWAGRHRSRDRRRDAAIDRAGDESRQRAALGIAAIALAAVRPCAAGARAAGPCGAGSTPGAGSGTVTSTITTASSGACRTARAA